MESTIAFIGAGNMATSIISGLIKSGYPANLIYVSNPTDAKLLNLKSKFGVNISNSNVEICKKCTNIILSVKPQIMEKVIDGLKDIDLSQKQFITIAAGITVDTYLSLFGKKVSLIRAMPNTPAQIGLGITGLYCPSNTESELVIKIFKAVGRVVWVKKESDLNQVIALAGSAPAYFYYFMEAMAKSKAIDLPEDVIKELVSSACIGAGAMVQKTEDVSISQLIANVTSKGGTTQAALIEFDKNNVKAIIDDALKACIGRATELENLIKIGKNSL